MAGKLKHSVERPAFRKLLVGDFSQHLGLPPAFIKNFKGRSLRKCTFRDPSGNGWAVELEQREDDLFVHNGWQGFVKDHFLEAGDFLIFEYDGGSKFDVTIYDKTCCEKDVEVAKRDSGNLAATRSGDGSIRRKRPTSAEKLAGSVFFESENPWFMNTLKDYNRSRMLIPKDLANAEGLMSNEGLKIEEAIMLQDPTGRSWLAKLHLTSDGRLMMTRGWLDFHSGNQISLGDTIVFEFVKQAVIQVHIFRGN